MGGGGVVYSVEIVTEDFKTLDSKAPSVLYSILYSHLISYIKDQEIKQVNYPKQKSEKKFNILRTVYGVFPGTNFCLFAHFIFQQVWSYLNKIIFLLLAVFGEPLIK